MGHTRAADKGDLGAAQIHRLEGIRLPGPVVWPGKQDPIVTVSQVGAKTDVHVGWFDVASRPTMQAQASIK